MAFILFLMGIPSVEAATITVTHLNDSGVGSLRAAITTAEMDATADTIEFGSLSGTISLSSALPNITRPLTITGNGNVTIAGAGVASAFRIIHVNVPGSGPRTPITFQSLTLSDGDALSLNQNGGAVLAEGNVSLVMTNCIFTGSFAVQGGAVAIVNNSQITLSGGRFENNTAGSSTTSGNGGAIFLGDGQLTVTKVRFQRNRAFTRGGAFAMNSLDGNSTAIILTSLFLQNDAAEGGGGVSVAESGNPATLDLQRVTFFGNDGDRGGIGPSGAGGIFTLGSPDVRIRNSLLALNGKNRSGTNADSFTGGTDNCEGSMTSQGQNLSDITDTQCHFGSSDFSAATAGINYTASSTQITLGSSVLLSTSQAIDQGSPAFCSSSTDLNTDIDSKASYGPCDIGAFEFGSCGDSFVQSGAGETCDPPSATCDSSCHLIVATGGSGGGSGGSGGSSGSGGTGGSIGSGSSGGSGGSGGSAGSGSGGTGGITPDVNPSVDSGGCQLISF